MGLKLTFTFEKETKNTFRYTQVADHDPEVGTLYIHRWAFDDKAPQEISVDITVTKE